jgi:hypothetical protein
MRIAVEGCCHGELDTIYSTLAHLQATEGKSVDLLIVCGDFQVCNFIDAHDDSVCAMKLIWTSWRAHRSTRAWERFGNTIPD